jgi:hypothetical protein
VTTVQLGSTSLVLDLLASARVMDARRIRERLDRTADALGLDRTVDDVLLPALRLIGAQWAGGTVDVAAEHLLSTVTSSWLAGLHVHQPEPSYDRPGAARLRAPGPAQPRPGVHRGAPGSAGGSTAATWVRGRRRRRW